MTLSAGVLVVVTNGVGVRFAIHLVPVLVVVELGRVLGDDQNALLVRDILDHHLLYVVRIVRFGHQDRLWFHFDLHELVRSVRVGGGRRDQAQGTEHGEQFELIHPWLFRRFRSFRWFDLVVAGSADGRMVIEVV